MCWTAELVTEAATWAANDPLQNSSPVKSNLKNRHL
jgi:hypothetical protein